MMGDPYSSPNSTETSSTLAAQRKSLLSESQLAALKPKQASALIGCVFETGGRKGRPWCDYCKKSGHIRDKCWKLHDKPANKKNYKNDTQGNMVISEESSHVPSPTESSPFSPARWKLSCKYFLIKVFSVIHPLLREVITHSVYLLTL